MIKKIKKETRTIYTYYSSEIKNRTKKYLSLIKKIRLLIYKETKSKSISTLLLPLQYQILPLSVTVIISITLILAFTLNPKTLPPITNFSLQTLLKYLAAFYLLILFLIILSTFISLVRHLFFKVNFSSYYSIFVEFAICYATLFILFTQLDDVFFPQLSSNYYFKVAPIYESYFLQFAYVHFVLFAVFLVIISIFMIIGTSLIFMNRSKRILFILNNLIHKYLGPVILIVFILIGFWITTYYMNSIYKLLIFNEAYENELIKATEVFLFDRDSGYYRNILTALCFLPIFKTIKNQ